MEIEAIYKFIAMSEGIDVEKIHSDSDLNSELGIDGDDFSELVEKFEMEFGVRMDSYLWYFHHGEEGRSIGSLFFKPPFERVERIPVTPKILLQAAMTKEWPISYPEHQLPERRYDVLINQLIVLGVLLWGIAWLFA